MTRSLMRLSPAPPRSRLDPDSEPPLALCVCAMCRAAAAATAAAAGGACVGNQLAQSSCETGTLLVPRPRCPKAWLPSRINHPEPQLFTVFHSIFSTVRHTRPRWPDSLVRRRVPLDTEVQVIRR
eukprot:COSAG01_NODE_30344_length_617_cov_4.274131_1_plen_124_part_10